MLFTDWVCKVFTEVPEKDTGCTAISRLTLSLALQKELKVSISEVQPPSYRWLLGWPWQIKPLLPRVSLIQLFFRQQVPMVRELVCITGAGGIILILRAGLTGCVEELHELSETVGNLVKEKGCAHSSSLPRMH